VSRILNTIRAADLRRPGGQPRHWLASGRAGRVPPL